MWEPHRPKIEWLYLDEGKSLGNIMDIMERDHGIKATKKQYLFHVRRWGLNENGEASKKIQNAVGFELEGAGA